MPASKNEPAAKDPTPVKHGVAQTEANKEANAGKEKAATDPNLVKHGEPTSPPPLTGNDPAPSKTDVKLRDLYDELELLKAEGNKNPERIAELKALIVKAQQ